MRLQVALAVRAGYVSVSLLAEGKEGTPHESREAARPRAFVADVATSLEGDDAWRRQRNRFRGRVANRLMYKYEEPSLFSGRRGAALIAVIILHIGIVWAFYTGLAGKLVQKIIPPVEIAQIDKPKDVDKPPPPPPKLEEIKPYVPPPEFVDIQAPQQETTAITQTTQGQQSRRRSRGAAAEAGHADPHGSEAPAEDRRRLLSRRVEARQRRGPMHRADDRVPRTGASPTSPFRQSSGFSAPG